MKTRGLTAGQARHFLDKGYVAVRRCFTAEAAAPWIASAYAEMGCEPDDPSTWKSEKVCLTGGGANVKVREFAPPAWEAVCGLVGGEGRVRGGPERQTWSPSFVVKFPCGDAGPSGRRNKEWHKDGAADGLKTRHYLDSPEMGLIAFVLWSDLKASGGGTFLAVDSIGPVARHLAEHPQGVETKSLPCRRIIDACRDFVQLTGRAGDVFLVHPYMLHAESRNAAGPPRFFTVRMVELNEPMNFGRRKKMEFSLVERAVLRRLGVERLDFRRANGTR